MLFATIGRGTPLRLIVLLALCYDALTSLRYTSMNTLVYADIADEKTSNAGSIVLSTAVLHKLKNGDGDNVCRRKDLHLG